MIDLNKAVTEMINDILNQRTDLPPADGTSAKSLDVLEGRVSDLENLDVDDIRSDLDELRDKVDEIDLDEYAINEMIDDKLTDFGAVGDDDVRNIIEDFLASDNDIIREIVRDEIAKAFLKLSEVLNNG